MFKEPFLLMEAIKRFDQLMACLSFLPKVPKSMYYHTDEVEFSI